MPINPNDDFDFNRICKIITDKVLLLQSEYPHINVTSLWKFRLLADNRKAFFVADECIDPILRNKILAIIEEATAS